MPVAAVLVAIAVDEAVDLVLDLHALHVPLAWRNVVGVDQRQHRDALELFGCVAERRLPGPVRLHEAAVHVADAQHVERHLEEGLQVAGGVLFDPRRARLASGEILVGAIASDGDGRQLRSRLDEGDVALARPADMAVIDREGAKHPAARSMDRLGPAGGEPRGLGQGPERPPERVSADVLDDHPLVAERGRAAGAHVRPHRDNLHRLAVGRRQVRRSRQRQGPAVLVHQVDAADD